MKTISKLFAFLAVIFWMQSCDKADGLPFYQTGEDISLTANPTTVALTPADSAAAKVTLSWNSPRFATAESNYKYVIELDSTANFNNPRAYTQMEATEIGLTGKDLNRMALMWGGNFDGAKEIFVRVRGSYGNNNDMKVSNVVQLSITPTAVPFSFTSSAAGPFSPTIDNRNEVVTTLNWTAPVIEGFIYDYFLVYGPSGSPLAEGTRVPLTTDMARDLTYLDLHTYARNAGIPVGTAGDVDMAVVAVVKGTGQEMYSNVRTLNITPGNMILRLHVAGDFQNWNPVAAPTLASTDGIHYEGYIYVPAGGSGEFKFVKGPDWSFGDYGKGEGEWDLGNGGNNLKWPATGKHYRVQVNTGNLTWSVTEITSWGVIGSGTPGGWDNSTPLTYDAATNTWRGPVNFTDGEFKFRANNAWDINLGGPAAGLNYGGDNIPVTAGNRTVVLNLGNPPVFTYSFQ